MAKITVLNEIVSNKIAAGEVVENPASVVKELVENSIDAGATQIEVTIESAGMKSLEVSDNGSGMSQEDAKLSVKRYATSKIENIEDLEAIQSYGFRGEALPSIASVSRFQIQTKQEKDDVGFQINIDGGHVTQEKEIPFNTGTVIRVEDLFYNTPARRKFLRQEKYEKAVIADVLTSIALVNPDISFTFKDANRKVFHFPLAQNWLKRIEQVFKNEFSEMIPVDLKQGDFHIYGAISKSQLQRVNKSKQYFFVNNRPVKYPRMSYSLQEAYHEYIMHGRYPYAVLFIQANPTKLDVNIHPQKQQVKIEGERILLELIYRVSREAILQSEAPISYTKQQPPQPDQTSPQNSFDSPTPYPADQDRERLTSPTVQESSSFASNQQEVAIQPNTATLESGFDLEESLPFGIQQIFGQIGQTYVLCEDEEGLVLIDQHAAHERVQYEALQNHLEGISKSSQTLLFPLTLNLTHEENATFSEIQENIQRYGFEINDLGQNTYSITAYPTVFEKEQIPQMLQAVIQSYQDKSSRKMFEDNIDFIAALMACKAKSVKANQKLSREEIQSLLKSLKKCKNPLHCCHGRPTFLKITMADLERKFKRKL